MLKKILKKLLIVCTFFITTFGQDAEETKTVAQEESYKTVNVKKFVFSYLVADENLKVKVSYPTTGWIAVGFNPVRKMKGANFIFGYNLNGKAVVGDEYGDSPYSHKSDTLLNGKNNIIESTCTEENKTTTLSFTIPLNSGDTKDVILEKGKEITIVLSAGKKDNFKIKHFKLAKTKIVL